MAFAQRMAAVPVSKVELSISCKNLLDKDTTSKSDPCAVLHMQDAGRWYEVGRTENIKNCLNPNFAHMFEVDYFFEEVQQLRISLWDLDNKTPQLDDDDFLGQMECTLGQVVAGSPFSRPLLQKKGKQAGKGNITVRATEVAKLNDILHLTFQATKLDKKDFMGKSDPYLEFSRQLPDGSWQVVHRTEVIKNTLNPRWKPFQIKAQKLCAGDYEHNIKVACYDFDDSNEADLIGEFSATIPRFMDGKQAQVDWPAINPKKKAKKKSYENSGVVSLMSCKVTQEHSFLDYVFGGMQINFTVGIDFTASNGDPRNPQSLHYINPYQPNEYQKAISAVGAVVQDYDSDKMFPALGFGARIPPAMETHHEFALNFNPTNPFCAGVEGILQAYTQCISTVQLYGPTNFSPIIYHVAQFAAAAQREEGARNYYVLLIITDGVITDMDRTLAAIVHASNLPMSIIIVGVGRADFSAMDLLDGDEGRLRAPSGEQARRDIVQFVPFRQFESAPPAELAKHVLAEIPQQVVAYYKAVGIAPGNPRAAAPPAQ